MEITDTEPCANCYQNVDQRNPAVRAFACSSCGAIALECLRCAQHASERRLSSIDLCAQCNLQEEASSE